MLQNTVCQFQIGRNCLQNLVYELLFLTISAIFIVLIGYRNCLIL